MNALRVAVAAVVSLTILASPAGAAEFKGPQRFIVVVRGAHSSNVLDSSGTVAAIGVIGGAGNVTVRETDSLLSFPGRGTLTVADEGGTQTDTRIGCNTLIHATGTFRIVAGTGQFAGVSGQGTTTSTIIVVNPSLPNGGCFLDGPFVVTADLRGQVSSG